MTENEAIEIIRDKIETCEFYFAEHDHYPKWCEYEFLESLGVAITALKEIQQYREIGTVEECREAVEKQKPKKIIIESYCSTECPTCGHELSTSLGDGYYKYPTFLERCPNCGQVIQWEENLEGMENE